MVDSLDPNSFGRCPLSEGYLVYVTFREVAVPPSLGSHVFGRMEREECQRK
jgi:hypothetical protein